MNSTSSGAPPSQGHALNVADFKSPTGNIGCIIAAGTARCDITNRDWSPPPHPASCPNEVNFGQGLIVGSNGPGHFVCAGDTAHDPSAPPLPYGSDTVSAGFRCQSRTAGMTCTALASGHGFFISIQSYRTF